MTDFLTRTADVVDLTSPTLRVLLVEDDDGDAFLVREYLAHVPDVRVTWVKTLAAGHAAIADGYSCVLLDLGLPDAHGVPMVRELIDASPAVAVLVLTGDADARAGMSAVAAGAQDYLVKSQVDAALLERAIRYAVERRRADDTAHALAASKMREDEAARLERGLLPQPLLRDARLRCRTRYRPGREQAVLGGDFFDVVERPDGTLHVVVGDVCGHGADEAALGVCLRIAFRALVLSGLPISDVLGVLDRLLVTERRGDEMFATVSALTVTPDRRRADVILAGHPAPLLLSGNTATALYAEPGVALGVVPGLTWRATGVDLLWPWSLLLYTDGLIEGRVGGGPARLGEAGLLDLVAAALPRTGHSTALLDDLLARAEQINRGPMSDDVAMLLLRFEPVDGRGR